MHISYTQSSLISCLSLVIYGIMIILQSSSAMYCHPPGTLEPVSTILSYYIQKNTEQPGILLT